VKGETMSRRKVIPKSLRLEVLNKSIGRAAEYYE
jgi:hypothetical protein